MAAFFHRPGQQPGRPLWIIALACGLADPASAAVHHVQSAEQLAPAVAAAVPGDVISVECDVGSFSIKGRHGVEQNPITSRADAWLKRNAKGTITIQDSSHLRVEGFTISGFTSTAIKIFGSSNLLVTRNKIDFTGIGAANGIYTSCDGGDMARKLWIHHNLFANIAPKTDKPGTANPFDGDSDREAVIFGEGGCQKLETEHLIGHNLSEDCDGEDEMISFKTSKNMFRFNTVKNCMGSVHLRFGNGSVVHGNLFIGDPVTDDFFGGIRSDSPDIGAVESGAGTPLQPVAKEDVGP